MNGGCPLCAGREAAVAHEGVLVLEGSELRQETRVCLGCALVHEVTWPDRDWIALYGTVWRRGSELSDELERLYESDAEVLGRGDGRLAYEVGCGAGFLLDRLAERGWRTAGCEPEREVAELARSKGHAVEDGRFDGGRAAARAAPVDLAILGDVLEHQPRPRALLEEVGAILAPEGRLYVRVPDLLAINYESFGDVFGLQHRVWFTRETLRATLAAAGFEVDEIVSEGPGMRALATRGEPRAPKLPRGEPERSIGLVRAYARDLRARRKRIAERLGRLRGREVALFGGGEHAAELLHFTELGEIATRVVDSNPSLWGACCGKLGIDPPRTLRERPPEVVVIASKAWQDPIAESLADLGARGVEVVKLYERGGHA